MKKSALILLPAMVALMLAGCSKNGGESSSTATSDTPTSATTTQPTSSSGTPTTPKPADQHVTGISVSPSKPFTVQVGETKKFTVSHEGSPTDQNEKAVTWKVSNDNLASIELVGTSQYYKNADVTFLAPGKVTVTVTSNYNSQFTRSVEVTIVENNDYIYLWNCQTGDKGKFTKIDEDLPLPQYIEDDVDLNGLSWHVTRHEASRDVYGSQNLQFGYGDKEGTIELSLINNREVESIQVSCSSKAEVIGKDDKGYDITADYGSSKISIKVGDSMYLNPVNTEKGTNPEAVTTPKRTSYSSGNILITFTPSVGYIALQNIIINYTHYVTELTVDSTGCKTTFEKGDTFDYGGLIALARYTNDAVYHDVSNLVNVIAPDLTTLGKKVVNVSYTEAGITVNSSYTIDVVGPRTVDLVSIEGSPLIREYFVGDDMNYAGLNVKVTFVDAEDEYFLIPLQDQGDFTDVNVPLYATLDMNNEWSISLKYKGVEVTKVFPANTFIVEMGSANFNMMNIDLAGLNTYVDIKDDNKIVNMHIAGDSSDKTKEKTGGYPAVANKNSIIFTTLDSSTAFKSFEFTFAPYITGTDPKTQTGTITVKDSILGQAPFNHELGSTKFAATDIENKKVSSDSLLKGSNAIEVSFSSQNHFGVVSFKFELCSEVNAIPSEITYVGEPSKIHYNYGEDFSPAGLTFYVNFINNYGPVTITEPETNIVWDKLNIGDVTATGHFLNLNVIVTGIDVSDYVGKTYSLVSEDLDDFSGTYLIACAYHETIWNGSLKTTTEMKDAGNGYSASFSSSYEVITGDYTVDHATFNIIKQENGFYRIFSASGFCCGITAKGGFSVVSSGGYDVNIYIVNGGYAVITNEGVEGTDIEKLAMIGCSKDGKYKEYSLTSSANMGIQLYKIDE